ncbi:MAG: hypothetical protein Q7R70_00450 [Candidatus Diapherotrites archaeon]|nr:hypothetical protein [Candidatus Diapherotrites archaeon]
MANSFKIWGWFFLLTWVLSILYFLLSGQFAFVVVLLPISAFAVIVEFYALRKNMSVALERIKTVESTLTLFYFLSLAFVVLQALSLVQFKNLFVFSNIGLVFGPAIFLSRFYSRKNTVAPESF